MFDVNITLLQEVMMCVKSSLKAVGWLQNYSKTIQTPKTLETQQMSEYSLDYF